MLGLKNKTIDYDAKTNIIERLAEYLVEYSRYLPKYTDMKLKIEGYLEALHVAEIIDWQTLHLVKNTVEWIHRDTIAQNRPMTYAEVRPRLNFLQSPLLRDKPKELDE